MRQPVMTYDEAIAHVALNDDPDCKSIAVVKQSISVDLLATIYGVSRTEIARRVVRIRKES